ncbi:hypothetical protein PRUPE_3G279500 [Prunus persica]|uniref:Uncharacterized protein n=1 Tax=Prunus persica TaxID=3760 RepID=A0A251Q6K5_PRUPE|nr:hypothetical protein PRUPE_3G279500 [Prunus persica]
MYKMDFKAMLLLFASVLLVSAEVSSNHGPHDQELNIKDRYIRYGNLRKWNPLFRAPPSPRQMNEAAPTGVLVVMPLSASRVKTNKDCVPLCDKRCKIETDKYICRRLCMACCGRCKCVPPGDYGSNMNKCGKCYTDKYYNGYKCP